MATNKNQHFVPRCYLKPFTIEGAGKRINLYNIDRKRFIPNAPVKFQCSRDYFYGQDPMLEDAIQATEVDYANTLAKVLAFKHSLTAIDAKSLKFFWLFQYLRTEAAAIRAVELSEKVLETTQVSHESFRVSIKDAVKDAMVTFAHINRILDDLECCLIRNRTKKPFITSDDPAVLTNKWWFSDRRTTGRSFGLRSSGAIILLPLSPEILFVGFDRDVYSLKNNQGYIDLWREDDVKLFNHHQILNCRANIFVRQEHHCKYVQKIYLEAEPKRLETRHQINYAVLDSAEGGFKRYKVTDPSSKKTTEEALVHVQALNPEPLSWPALFSRSLNNAVYYNGTGAGFIRFEATFQHNGPPFKREPAY